MNETHENQAGIELKRVPLDRIVIRPNHNPRRRFRQVSMESLIESVRQNGVIQPVLLRFTDQDEVYELIAGERRFRASKAANLHDIPVQIRDMSDAEAAELAMVENAQRENLSPAEEALSAQDFVSLYDGDHDKAAAALGWTVAKLKHRMRLNHASAAVMEAFMDEKLQMGHVELLATLPPESQDKALPRIIAENLTVAALRENLQGHSIPLTQAIFSTKDCQTCEFNSGCQRNLFDTVIDADRCTNRTCFSEKTANAVKEKQAQLQSDYGTVALLTEKPSGSTVHLTAEGSGGVGPEQFRACKTCVHRGCVIDNRVGTSTGRVEHSLCFNRTCHSEKVDLYKKQIDAVLVDSEVESNDTSDESTNSDQSPDSASQTKQKVTNQKAKPKSSPTAATVSNQLADGYAGIHLRAFDQALQTDPRPVLAMSCYALASLAIADIDRTLSVTQLFKDAGMINAKGTDHNQLLIELMALDKAALQSILANLNFRYFHHKPNDHPHFQAKLRRRKIVGGFLRNIAADLKPHVLVDEDFLERHTKPGIEQVLEDSGFRKAVEAKSDGSKRYREIVNQSKKDMIKKVIGEGFDFSGYVPSALSKFPQKGLDDR